MTYPFPFKNLFLSRWLSVEEKEKKKHNALKKNFFFFLFLMSFFENSTFMFPTIQENIVLNSYVNPNVMYFISLRHSSSKHTEIIPWLFLYTLHIILNPKEVFIRHKN